MITKIMKAKILLSQLKAIQERRFEKMSKRTNLKMI